MSRFAPSHHTKTKKEILFNNVGSYTNKSYPSILYKNKITR